MKKTTIILALAFGLGFLLPSTVKAIHPMQFTGIILNANTDFCIEKDIMLEDWMLRIESFTGTAENTSDQEPELKAWMLDASWGENEPRLTSESELRLEEWMLGSFDKEDRTIALEDWMLQIAG